MYIFGVLESFAAGSRFQVSKNSAVHPAAVSTETFANHGWTFDIYKSKFRNANDPSWSDTHAVLNSLQDFCVEVTASIRGPDGNMFVKTKRINLRDGVLDIADQDSSALTQRYS